MKRTGTGFTLIETAIVLIIIGLLLGGVLKGQELINSAKAKAMASDFRNVPIFIYSYQDKFRALPGDDPAVQSHLGAAATQVATVAAAGSAGNGRLDGFWNSASAADESFILWQHVRLAGLAPGSTRTDDGSYRPTNADGGFVGIESIHQPTGGAYVQDLGGTYLLCSGGVLGKFARQVDLTLDDGNGATGQVRIVPGSGYARNASAGINNAANPASISDAGQYTVCMGF